MTLYDNYIKQIKSLLPHGKRFCSNDKTVAKSDKNAILLLRDTAYELGGSQLPCVSTMAVSSSICFDDCVTVIGKDIYEISKDSPFAKIVFIEIDDIDEEAAFDKIKELELLRYKFCIDGLMTRASALSMREQIRVSKKAVSSKLSFADYGSAIINEYKKNPLVKSVEVIFVTQLESFDEISAVAERIKSTTSALNHILDNVIFDCSTCNLKPICDEVDGMKELHFKKSKA